MSLYFSVNTIDAEQFRTELAEADSPDEVYAALNAAGDDSVSVDVDEHDINSVAMSEEGDYRGSVFEVLHQDLGFENPTDGIDRAVELLSKIHSSEGNLVEYEPLIGYLDRQEVAELEELLAEIEVSDYLREVAIPPVRQTLRKVLDTQQGIFVLMS